MKTLFLAVLHSYPACSNGHRSNIQIITTENIINLLTSNLSSYRFHAFELSIKVIQRDCLHFTNLSETRLSSDGVCSISHTCPLAQSRTFFVEQSSDKLQQTALTTGLLDSCDLINILVAWNSSLFTFDKYTSRTNTHRFGPGTVVVKITISPIFSGYELQ